MHITSVSLTAILLVSSMTPAYAQGYAKERPMVRTNHLQPVTFFTARPQVGIEATGPIVSDWRRSTQSQPLVVPIPAMPADGGGAVMVPAGAIPMGGNVYGMPVPATGSGIGSSNPMLGDRGYLQHAGPRSYVPSSPITAGRDLPSGVTTGVHGNLRQAPNPVSSAPSGVFKTPMVVHRATAPVTAHYTDPVGSVGNSGTTTTHTNTSIKLLNKQR